MEKDVTKEAREAMIDKIAMLMEKTVEQGCTPEEADAAINKAKELMLKYNIEMAKITNREQTQANGAEKETVQYFDAEHWEQKLGWGISRAFQCKGIGHQSFMSFIGVRVDLELTMYFFNRFLRFIPSMAYKEFPQKSYKRKRADFCSGASDAICVRLEELYKRFKEEAPPDTMALIVLKDGMIDKYIAEHFGKLGFDRRRQRPTDAYRKGVAAGQGVSLASHRDKVKGG